MADPPKDDRSTVERLAWTLPQRRALLVILSVLCAGLGIRYTCNPVYVSDPQPDRPPRFDQLADRIDPNTADLNTLIALPQLGEKRAQAIIDFREKRRTLHPGETVFKTAADLTTVRGIGWATVETLKPYLIFPGERPAAGPPTRP